MDVFEFYYERADPPDPERVDKADARLAHDRNRKNDG